MGQRADAGGIGIRAVNPMSLAIAAGANFVGRGFSGDPQGLADLIVEGIKRPGFAFLQVMSPCITFRPEEFEWKHTMRHDAVVAARSRGAAAAAAMADDGLSLGVLYRGAEAAAAIPSQAQSSLAAIERQFAVAGHA